MEEKRKPFRLGDFIVNIDVYIGAIIFILIMILLSAQVLSRYVFNYSLTWTEELAIQLFVVMAYLGISSAVTYRKHLRIDALLDAVPFAAKKTMLIASDIVFICFNTYVTYSFINIINSLGSSASPILRIPKVIAYSFIPLMLTIASIKLVFDIKKLIGEKKHEIGYSKPAIDFDAIQNERRGAE